MDSINTRQLLTQLNDMAEKAGLPKNIGDNTSSGTAFTDVLQKSFNDVSQRQQSAAQLAQRFDMEDPNVDLSHVMVEMQKARVSFEALMQVRNRLVSAYEEVMNMPL
jgi:flagellar hook-basal body complex protein FliE